MSDIIDRTPPCVTVLINEIDRTIIDHFEVEPGTTVQQWVDDFGYDIYTSPFAFFFNSAPLAQIDWESTTFEEGDVLTLVGQPGLVITGTALVFFWIGVALTVASTAYALYTVLTMDQYDPSDEEASPNYSISYRGNRSRRDKCRPVLYGELRIFPDSIGYYRQYLENEQWMYQLFEVTLGETEVITEADCQYEDTPLTNFTQYQFEYLPPGQESKIFPSDEHVSSEVQGIELVDAGPSTAYVVCGPGEKVGSISYDISMPQGFYRIDGDGDVEHQLLRIWFEFQQVDDSGNPIGNWHAEEVVIGSNGIDPIRITHTIPIATSIWDLPVARYQARINRETAANNTTNILDMFVWDSLRATLITPASDTLSTRIAIAVRQSEKVGNLALSQFNVLAKRKIPGWGNSTPTHTKSSVLAFRDAVTADYGGGHPEDRLDVAALQALDAENRPYTDFSGIYDTGIDLWKVLNEMARCHLGAAVELPGGKLTIVPDDPDVTPTMLVGQDRIVKDTFKMEQKTLLSLDYDYVIVTYKDASEGYRETAVECVPFGSPKLSPKQIVLRGPTDQDSAWEVGIRIMNEHKWRRTAISFQLGLEGLIPTYGTTIRVAHYMLDIMGSPFGKSGAIKSASGGTLTVYEDVSSLQGQGGLVVYVRDASAAPLGPYSASVTGRHTISASVDTSGLVFADDVPRPTFAIGGGADFITTMKVNRVQMVSEHVVEVGGFEDNGNVYIKDLPPTFENLPAPDNLTPQVLNLTGELYGDNGKARVRLAWVGVYSDYYIIELSTDNQATWSRAGRTTDEFWDGVVPQISIYMRVTGVGLVFGVPAVIGFNVGDYVLSLPAITNLRAKEPFIDHTATIIWDYPPPDMSVYVEFWWNGKKQRDAIYPGNAIEAAYNWWMAWTDDPYEYDGVQWPKIGARTIQFHCHMMDMSGQIGVPQIIELKNEQMDFVLNASYKEELPNLLINYQFPNTDYSGVDMHMSQTQGFTPDLTPGDASTTRVYQGQDTSVVLSDVLEPNSTYYFLMAGFDIWGVSDDLNWSTELRIDTADDVTGGPIEWDDIVNKPPNLENAPPFGVQVNTFTFNGGNGSSPGRYYVHGYEDGKPADTAITLARVDDSSVFHTFGPLAGNATGNGALGYIVYSPTGNIFTISGQPHNTAFCYYSAGNWWYNNGTDATTFDVGDGNERYAIANCVYDQGGSIDAAAPHSALFDLQIVTLSYVYADWDGVSGPGKPQDGAEVNAPTLGLRLNHWTFLDPSNGWVFAHGYVNGQPAARPGTYEYNGQIREFGNFGINCRTGIGAAQGFLAVDYTLSQAVGGYDAAFVFYDMNGDQWYYCDGSTNAWSNPYDEDVVILGSIYYDGTVITHCTVDAPTNTRAIEQLLRSAVWDDVSDPSGTKPDDNADQTAFKIGLSLNKRTFGGGQELGWVVVHGITNGVGSNTPAQFNYDSVQYQFGPDDVDCRGADNEAVFIIKDLSDSGLVGGLNLNAVEYIAYGDWRIRSSGAAWNEEDNYLCVAIAQVRILGNAIYQANVFEPMAPLTAVEAWRKAEWDQVTGPGKPTDYAQPNGGDGFNRVLPQHQLFFKDDAPTFAGGVGWWSSDALLGDRSFVPNDYEQVHFDRTTTTYSIALQAGSKYIISCLARSSSGTSTARVRIKTNTGAYYGSVHTIKDMQGGGYIYPSTSWKQFIGMLDLTGDLSSYKCHLVVNSDSGADTYFEGFHLERLSNPNITPTIDDFSGYSGYGKDAIKTANMIPDAVTAQTRIELTSDTVIYDDTWVQFMPNTFIDYTPYSDIRLQMVVHISTWNPVNEFADLDARAAFLLDGALIGYWMCDLHHMFPEYTGGVRDGLPWTKQLYFDLTLPGAGLDGSSSFGFGMTATNCDLMVYGGSTMMTVSEFKR